MTPLERFRAVMDYQPVDRLPHWELGAWGQANERWTAEGLAPERHLGDWFEGLPAWDMDPRIYAPLDFKLRPSFEYQVLEEDDQYLVARHGNGVVTKALKTGTVRGTRSSMDQYLAHPVETHDDWRRLKARYDPTDPARYPANWDDLVATWQQRDCPLVLGRNCSGGFYWNAREWLGTENLSTAFYDQPAMLHDMFEFLADFIIELTRRARRDIVFDYFVLNEDLAFKSAPLVSPDTYAKFIVPPMKRLIDTLKREGVRYVALDTDGNPLPLVPLMMDAGVDILWPLERAADNSDPHLLRRRFGRSLRLWGGVDKREVAKGVPEVVHHLQELADVCADGGYIPHLDHTFPPDVSRRALEEYFAAKDNLLCGRW